jgi:hypothetical protein
VAPSNNYLKYNQKTIQKRIEAFLLDNVGKVVTNTEIKEVARDLKTGEIPENWHQRLSELRTDHGYDILTKRDISSLKAGEYMLRSAEKRPRVGKRVLPSKETWNQVLRRAENKCEWDEDGIRCNLIPGDIDPIGGGKVKLTPDHSTPHSIDPNTDPNDPSKWRALCSRHQVTKKNYWDNETGKINYIGIMQAAKADDKKMVYEFLKGYFEKD